MLTWLILNNCKKQAFVQHDVDYQWGKQYTHGTNEIHSMSEHTTHNLESINS